MLDALKAASINALSNRLTFFINLETKYGIGCGDNLARVHTRACAHVGWTGWTVGRSLCLCGL